MAGNNTYENLLDPFPATRGVAANTFTTAKDISPTPIRTVLGNELKLGSVVELEAYGEFSTTGTPTLQIGFAYGMTQGGLASTGVTVAASGAITTATGAASFPWHAKVLLLVTAIGTAGTMYVPSGILDLGTSLIVSAGSWMPVTAAARAVTGIDTTVVKTFGVFAAYSVSSVSNAITCDVFTAKIVNQGKTG